MSYALQVDYDKSTRAVQAYKELPIYGQNVLLKAATQRRFSRFRSVWKMLFVVVDQLRKNIVEIIAKVRNTDTWVAMISSRR